MTTAPQANSSPEQQELSLNVKNAFDKYYLKTSALRGDGRGILLTYQLTHSGSRL